MSLYNGSELQIPATRDSVPLDLCRVLWNLVLIFSGLVIGTGFST